MGTSALGVEAPLSIPLPCVPDDSPCSLSFLKCSAIFEHMIGSTQKPGAVEAMVTSKINYFYQGIDAKLFSGAAVVTGGTFQTPVCNLAESEIDNPNTTLHPAPKDPTCGKYTKFIKGESDFSNGNGSRERAYFQGTYTQAWKCFKQQVFDEIRKNKNLQVKSPTDAAKDVKVKIDGLLNQIKSGALKAVCNAPAGCNFTEDQCTYNVDTLNDSRCQRVAICKLMAGHSLLRAAFEYLVYQEIEARAVQSWLMNQPLILDQVSQDVFSKCNPGDACAIAKIPKDIRGGYTLTNPLCASDKLNSCYPKAVLSKMQSLVQQYYPSNGSCQ